MAQRSTDLYTLLRIIYQPGRIIIGYFQVVTQIGLVLNLDYPHFMQQILELLKVLAVDLQIVELDFCSLIFQKVLYRVQAIDTAERLRLQIGPINGTPRPPRN